MFRLARPVSGGLVGLVAVTGLLTGCATSSPSGSTAPTTTVTVTPSAPASSSSETAAVPTPTATASTRATRTAATAPGAPVRQCADAALAVSVKYDPDSAGAGQRASWVIFRNTGSTPCTLEGTPGVSLVGHGTGKQLGQPAYRGAGGNTGGATVTIPPGSYAGALLQYTYVDASGGNFNLGHGTTDDPACKAAPADGYRIYPPHSYRAFFAPAPTYACTTSTHWITVGAVVPAARIDIHP